MPGPRQVPCGGQEGIRKSLGCIEPPPLTSHITLKSLNPHTNPMKYSFYPHFKDEEIEAHEVNIYKTFTTCQALF